MHKNMEQNEQMKSLLLTDEDENEIEFDIMDSFDFNGETYFVLLPVDDDSDDIEYVILQEKGEGELIGIDDENTLELVFDEYKRRNDLEN